MYIHTPLKSNQVNNWKQWLEEDPFLLDGDFSVFFAKFEGVFQIARWWASLSAFCNPKRWWYFDIRNSSWCFFPFSGDIFAGPGVQEDDAGILQTKLGKNNQSIDAFSFCLFKKNKTSWIHPGRLTWNIIMKVWFRSFSFLFICDGWFTWTSR